MEGTADAMDAKGVDADMNAPKPDVNDLEGWGAAALEDEDVAAWSEGLDARSGELLVAPKALPVTLAKGDAPEKAAKPV